MPGSNFGHDAVTERMMACQGQTAVTPLGEVEREHVRNQRAEDDLPIRRVLELHINLQKLKRSIIT